MLQPHVCGSNDRTILHATVWKYRCQSSLSAKTAQRREGLPGDPRDPARLLWSGDTFALMQGGNGRSKSSSGDMHAMINGV